MSAARALDCEVRLYDKLFTVPDPEAVEDGEDFYDARESGFAGRVPDAKIEPSVASDPADARYQFERTGYFVQDVGRLEAGRAGVQPHGDAARHLGEDEREIVMSHCRPRRADRWILHLENGH